MADNNLSKTTTRWGAIAALLAAIPVAGYLFKNNEAQKPQPMPPAAMADATPGPLVAETPPQSYQDLVEERKAELTGKINEYLTTKTTELHADIARRQTVPSRENERIIELRTKLAETLDKLHDGGHSLQNYIAGKILHGQQPHQSIRTQVEAIDAQILMNAGLDDKNWQNIATDIKTEMQMLVELTTPVQGRTGRG